MFWTERDGWGHYYLYDARRHAEEPGHHGEFVAKIIDGIDEKTRDNLPHRRGREEGEDPYYHAPLSRRLDGSGLKLLDPGDASHAVDIERRRPLLHRQLLAGGPRAEDGPATTRWATRHEARDGGPERAQGGRLQVPRAVQGEGRRRRHRPLRRDVQAVRFRPDEEVPDHRLRLSRAADRERHQDVQPARQQHVAGAVRVHRDRGRQPRRQPARARSGTTPSATATCATTAWPTRRRRSSSWRTRYPYIDIDRVGIWGHSGGGFMSAAAMLVYPDFFKVGVVRVRQPREQHLQQHVEREAPRHQGSRGQGRQGHLRVHHREELARSPRT